MNSGLAFSPLHPPWCRVFPLIGMVKQQQQDIVLPNLMKSQMEPKHMFLADFSEVGGWKL